MNENVVQISIVDGKNFLLHILAKLSQTVSKLLNYFTFRNDLAGECQSNSLYLQMMQKKNDKHVDLVEIIGKN